MTERTPAEVFPPGEFLRDELECRNWTQTEFAEIIGRPPRVVNEIIAGKRSVTPETAREFAAALGTSAQFWLNLETSYRLSKTAPASERISRAAVLHERFPVREMTKRGWIKPSENYDVLETRVLNYFHLESPQDELSFNHAARRNYENDLTGIQWAWIFRARQLATALHTESFTKAALKSAVSELESLMSEPEEIRHVPRILAGAGVRLVIIETIPGSKIEGVCFWIQKSPVIALSMRFDRIDNFWFNLRHEIEHVLNEDGKENPIIDNVEEMVGESDMNECERLANEAATNFCVPSQKMDDFIARLDPMYSTKNLIGFSRLVSRHPGIVAGQLQRKTGRWELFKKFQVKVREIITQSAMTDGFGHEMPVDI